MAEQEKEFLHGTFDELLQSTDPKDRPNPPMPAVTNLRHSLRTLFHVAGGKGTSVEELMSRMEPRSVRWALAQEEWDGGNLSVKYLDIDGQEAGDAADLPVLLVGGDSWPFVAKDDVVPVVVALGSPRVILQADSVKVGDYRFCFAAPGAAVSSLANEATQEAATGENRWYRLADGGTVHVPEGGGLDGVTVPDFQGKAPFGFNGADANFDGTAVGGQVSETGGGKTHTHDPHTIAFEALDPGETPITTDSNKDETGLAVSSGAADGTHGHDGQANSIDLSHDHALSYAAAVEAASGSGVAIPDAVSTQSLETGTIDVDVGGSDGSHQHSNATVDIPGHTHSLTDLGQITPTIDAGSTDLTHNYANHLNPYQTALVLIKVA